MKLYFHVGMDYIYSGPNWHFFPLPEGPLVALIDSPVAHAWKLEMIPTLLAKTGELPAPLTMMAE